MREKRYARLFCCQGVFWEQEFSTEAEARACVLGALAVLNEVDIVNDAIDAEVDWKPTPKQVELRCLNGGVSPGDTY